MWFPDEKMDINKFVDVHVPAKSTYLQRFGYTNAPSTMYTGDDFAPIPKDKISSIADMEAYDAMMQAEEAKQSGDGQS